MKKLKRIKTRALALFLCFVMLLNICPAFPVQASQDPSDGNIITDVILPQNEHVKIQANKAELGEGDYQWQILLPMYNEENQETWVNISGAVGETLDLSYAMVANMLINDQAMIRCKVTNGELVTYGAMSLVTVNYAVASESNASIEFTILDPGSVEEFIEAPESSDSESTIASSSNAILATDSDVRIASSSNASKKTTRVNLIKMFAQKMNVNTFSDGDSITTHDAASDVKKTYNIIINYKFENNEIVSDPYTANLAEGSSFSATVTFPTVLGYLPYVGDTQQDSIELNYASVSEDVTIDVVYKPTNVDYTVIHYQQNVENDQYTEVVRETKQGLTNSQVPEVAKTYEGFYSLLYERPAIAADGSTVIEVYYDRYYYLMNFDMDGGYGTEPVYARYGAAIGEVKAPTKAGYTFGGWAETKSGTTEVTLPKTMPAANKTYHAIWTPDETAKVTVVFWGENADDKNYSYLSEYTKEINLKPGTEFTYSEKEMLVCDKEVHTHTDACLGCGKVEHTHSAVGERCYKLTCTEEAHAHGTECYAGVGDQQDVYTRLPDNPKDGQIYDHWYHNMLIYIKGSWYRYSGSTASGNIAPTTCGKQESNHAHGNTCYTLTCTTEVHTHGDACYSCGIKKHTHNSDCYMQGAGLDTTKWKFVKSDTIAVAADGSSVVNVYYDRVEYSVQFYNGRGNTEYTDIKITAKWGAFIGDKWPTRNNSGTWAVNPSNNNNVSGPYQVYLQEMPVGGDKFYGPKTDSGTQSAYYYVEILPGETGTETYNNKSYKLHHTDTSPGSGYVVTDDDKYAIQGFTFVGFKANINSNGNYYYNNAKFYYTRNSYKLTFNDQYNDVRNETVKFEAPLSTYKDYVPEVPSAYEPGSVEFGGWYQNPQCTGEEYKLDEQKMPSHDIILYAKWTPVNRTVKFYLTESSAEVYKPAAAETAASFTVPHGSTLDKEYVDAHLTQGAMNGAKPNGDYSFVMWYYIENGAKHPFDPSTAIRKDLTLYGEWSSNVLKAYTVQYVLKDDHRVKIADDLTGSGLAGTTKTFDAKGGDELYADYQEGYFPTVQSQSLLLDIDKENLTITFEYVPMPAVPYTVKYVETDTGNSLAADKVVSDNRKAVVTETFQPISGYMPDAYQKRLVVTADGENILYFYYTKDTEHAYYKITHYTQNTDGTTWTDHASSQAIGDIGTRYTASPMTISGFTYDHIEYVVNGTEVTDVTEEGAKLTENGLEINLYYVRSEYPYQVRYLEQGTGKQLHDPKNGTGKYGQVISESAIDIDGYAKVDPTSATLNIRIDEGEGAPKLNIITFYYKEAEVTINYVAVGPDGATNFGSVAPTTETVKVVSGTAQGSTPTAGDGFKFVGWYKDEDCTQPVDTSWVTDNKIAPQKTDEKNVAATYYAKFEYDMFDLTIVKEGAESADESFIFKVTSDGVSREVVVKMGKPVTIEKLPAGQTYTVEEISDWSWRYKVTKVTNSQDQPLPLANGKQVSFVLTGNETITFTNEVEETKWLDGNTWCQNIFKKNSTVNKGSNVIVKKAVNAN